MVSICGVNTLQVANMPPSCKTNSCIISSWNYSDFAWSEKQMCTNEDTHMPVLTTKYLSHTHTHTLLPSWLACTSPCDHYGHSSAGIQGTPHAPGCTVGPWSLGDHSRWRPRSPHGLSWPCSWSRGPGSCRSRCRSPASSRWNISPHRTRSVFVATAVKIFCLPADTCTENVWECCSQRGAKLLLK